MKVAITNEDSGSPNAPSDAARSLLLTFQWTLNTLRVQTLSELLKPTKPKVARTKQVAAALTRVSWPWDRAVLYTQTLGNEGEPGRKLCTPHTVAASTRTRPRAALRAGPWPPAAPHGEQR